MSEGYVYILTNEHMPGLIKVGRTKKAPHIRAGELYQTGVPGDFEVFNSFFCPDHEATEAAFHKQFESDRINEKREFFSTNPSHAERWFIDRLRSELSQYVEKYLPDHLVIEGAFYVDPGEICEVAGKAGVHPFEVADAFWLIDPKAVHDAVEAKRARDKAIRQRAESNPEE